MKKRVFGILGVAAFAALIAVNVSINSRSEDLSDIALANIEALAGGENGDYTQKIYNIYQRPDGTGHNCWSGGSEPCE